MVSIRQMRRDGNKVGIKQKKSRRGDKKKAKILIEKYYYEDIDEVNKLFSNGVG